MPVLARPAATEYDAFYQGYVDRVPEGDVLRLLETQLPDTLSLLQTVSAEQALHRYAEGKWSVKEVVGHMADVERILSYRTLRIARGDATPLPGFEENAYVAAAHFDRRILSDLVDELAQVRRATLILLKGLDEAAFARVGTANGAPVSVRALVYIIAGHERHHVAILRERYGVGAASV